MPNTKSAERRMRNAPASAFTIAAFNPASSLEKKYVALLAAEKKKMRRLSARRHFRF